MACESATLCMAQSGRLNLCRTECGPVVKLSVADESRPLDWEYFRLPNPDFMTIELVPHIGSGASWEPVVMVKSLLSSATLGLTHAGGGTLKP